MPSNAIRNLKFRGALTGVLVGDCVGAIFEGKSVDPSTVLDSITQLVSSTGPKPLKHTDDTAMTTATIRSLIRCKGFNASDLAKEYSINYFREPYRGYGGAIRQVFTSLKSTDYQNPFEPATRQFDGAGSFGNGAAMRCSGIALFACKMGLDKTQTQDLTTNCSRITHSHLHAINGAILLVDAIMFVLALEEDSLDEDRFIDYLIKRMAELEDETDRVYTEKLKNIKLIVDKTSITGVDVSQEEVVTLLGNDVSAPGSVPLAIYSFIRGTSKFNDRYRLDNEFIRTLHWAISCGGDTDTIASMACGLCGAYLGVNKISTNVYKRCESFEYILNLADLLSML